MLKAFLPCTGQIYRHVDLCTSLTSQSLLVISVFLVVVLVVKLHRKTQAKNHIFHRDI